MTCLIGLFLLVPGHLHATQAPPKNRIGLCGNSDYYNEIRTLWEQLKPLYRKWIEDSAVTPYNLYNIQTETDNALEYAGYCRDMYMLDELANLYLLAVDTLNETDEYIFYYYPLDGPRCSKHRLKAKHRLWLDREGHESILVSSQFLYLISRTLQILCNVPPEERTPGMRKFIAIYPAILHDHYQRWIFTSPGPFQVRGWGCKVKGKYVRTGMNHAEFLTRKLRNELGDKSCPSYCNAVTDTDMWIIAGAACLTATGRVHADILSQKEIAKYIKYIQTGIRLLKSRITYKRLQDWNGNPVTGANFDLGAWDDHSDYDYAGFKPSIYPKPYQDLHIKFRAKNVGWDLSHARRFVHVFGALHDNRGILDLSFPDDTFMKQLANQFLYGAFNGDFKKPLFSNFMDGTNGWFRVGYDGRTGFGYGPLDMSIAALTGGYGFWSKYNHDIEKLYSSLLAMLNSNDPEVREHVREHYETNYWSHFKRPHSINFSKHPLSVSTRRVMFQLLPSLCFQHKGEWLMNSVGRSTAKIQDK